MKNIRPPRPEPPTGRTIPDELWDMTTRCWTRNASERPSFDVIVLSMSQLIRGYGTIVVPSGQDTAKSAATSVRSQTNSAREKVLYAIAKYAFEASLFFQSGGDDADFDYETSPLLRMSWLLMQESSFEMCILRRQVVGGMGEKWTDSRMGGIPVRSLFLIWWRSLCLTYLILSLIRVSGQGGVHCSCSIFVSLKF